MKIKSLAPALALGVLATAAHAQSSVTIYGSIDEYLNAMSSSSGTKILALQDGSTLRSRLGFKGTEDLGGGLAAKFNLEQGIGATSGSPADTTRAFDRQAWLGLAGNWGEFRMGRQNGVVFYRGDYIDYTSRTLGSVVNAFGTPSRYDNDLSYTSPRMAGVLLEVHYALGGTTAGTTNNGIFQSGIDYLNGPFRVGYAGISSKAPAGSTVTAMYYNNFYANYDYGHGKLYAVYIKSNNNINSGALDNGGTLLGNTGGTLPATTASAINDYTIYQFSADYNVNDRLRIGGLYGKINDPAVAGQYANGYSIGAYYALSKRTTLLAMVDSLKNGANAGFRQSASAGMTSQFTAASDVNGQTINGVQFGVVHKF